MEHINYITVLLGEVAPILKIIKKNMNKWLDINLEEILYPVQHLEIN